MECCRYLVFLTEWLYEALKLVLHISLLFIYFNNHLDLGRVVKKPSKNCQDNI